LNELLTVLLIVAGRLPFALLDCGERSPLWEKEGGYVQSQSRHHPSPKKYILNVGYQYLAYGEPGGKTGSLEATPRRPRNSPFPAGKVDEAYKLMAEGNCGKVAVYFDEELKQHFYMGLRASTSHCWGVG
jgi:hypothetical protein